MSNRREWREVMGGVLLTLGLHSLSIVVALIGGGILLWVASAVFYLFQVPAPLANQVGSQTGIALAYWIFGIGLSQLFYVVPLIFWFARQRRFGVVKGIIIAALLTMLLNGACFYLFQRQ